MAAKGAAAESQLPQPSLYPRLTPGAGNQAMMPHLMAAMENSSDAAQGNGSLIHSNGSRGAKQHNRTVHANDFAGILSANSTANGGSFKRPYSSMVGTQASAYIYQDHLSTVNHGNSRSRRSTGGSSAGESAAYDEGGDSSSYLAADYGAGQPIAKRRIRGAMHAFSSVTPSAPPGVLSFAALEEATGVPLLSVFGASDLFGATRQRQLMQQQMAMQQQQGGGGEAGTRTGTATGLNTQQATRGVNGKAGQLSVPMPPSHCLDDKRLVQHQLQQHQGQQGHQQQGHLQQQFLALLQEQQHAQHMVNNMAQVLQQQQQRQQQQQQQSTEIQQLQQSQHHRSTAQQSFDMLEQLAMLSGSLAKEGSTEVALVKVEVGGGGEAVGVAAGGPAAAGVAVAAEAAAAAAPPPPAAPAAPAAAPATAEAAVPAEAKAG
jgi:hypothetical protein